MRVNSMKNGKVYDKLFIERNIVEDGRVILNISN
jgi:hypothetical protein